MTSGRWLDRARRVGSRAKQRVVHTIRGGHSADDLRAAGVTIGPNVAIENGVWLDLEWGWLIELRESVTLSPRVMIFAHDASTRRPLKFTKIAPVTIGARTYVGAGTIILPGVSIGADAIIGAGSLVNRDIPDAVLAAGVPARVVCSVEDYLERRAKDIDTGLVLGDVRRRWGEPTWPAERRRLAERVRAAGIAWVK